MIRLKEYYTIATIGNATLYFSLPIYFNEVTKFGFKLNPIEINICKELVIIHLLGIKFTWFGWIVKD